MRVRDNLAGRRTSMKTWVKIEPIDLEDDDTICGFRARDLILFATAARKMGIDNADLAKFARDTESAYNFVVREQKEAMEQSLRHLSAIELRKVRK